VKVVGGCLLGGIVNNLLPAASLIVIIIIMRDVHGQDAQEVLLQLAVPGIILQIIVTLQELIGGEDAHLTDAMELQLCVTLFPM